MMAEEPMLASVKEWSVWCCCLLSVLSGLPLLAFVRLSLPAALHFLFL